MHFIALGQQEFRQIGAVLAGNPGNECNFVQRNSPFERPIPIVIGFLLTKHKIAPYHNSAAINSNDEAVNQAIA